MANNIRTGTNYSRSVNYTVFASAARTTTPDTEEFEIGPGWQSLTLVVNTTAASSPSTVFKVEAIDRATGQAFGSCPTAAITGTGVVTLRISPHLTAAGTTIYKDVVHPIVRVTATHGNGNSHTYTVGMLLA